MASSTRPAILDGWSAEERRALLSAAGLDRWQAVFAVVPAPRARRGRRYGLPVLLTCLVAALPCICDTRAAVGPWCREQRALLKRRDPHYRFLRPTGALFRWLLPHLSVAELAGGLAAWVRHTRALRAQEALALEGKTVRGAAVVQPDGTRQETLRQVRVDDKPNEIPVAQALLP